MQRGSGTWGSLSGGGSRVREWCPLALHTSRSWGCCTAEHTGKCPSSLFPSAFLCPASEWFPGRTDSKRAIPADLMSHHCLFPKALPYIQQHPINTLLGPRHPVVFPPFASHWISFIAYSFMWSSNNSLCTSLRGPSSGEHTGIFQGDVWVSLHSLSSNERSAAGEAVMLWAHVPTLRCFLFSLEAFACSQRNIFIAVEK